MTTFPYFKTRFSEDDPAKTANRANTQPKISHFSHISKHTLENAENIIPFPDDLIEAYEERAAIMQYGAGLSREQAEILAFHDITKNMTENKTKNA